VLPVVKTPCRIICKLPLVGSGIHAMLTYCTRKVQEQWYPGDMQMHGGLSWHVFEMHYKIERVISVGSGMRMTQEENEVILELLSPNKIVVCQQKL